MADKMSFTSGRFSLDVGGHNVGFLKKFSGLAMEADAVTHDRVLVRMSPIQNGAPEMWPFVVRLLDEAVARGYLAPAPGAVPAA